MSAHTPGPWQVSNDNVVHNGEARVAKVLRHRGWESDDEANARLIAAAPEMLEALHGILSQENAAVIGNGGPWNDPVTRAAFNAVRAAIAKAEGREP